MPTISLRLQQDFFSISVMPLGGTSISISRGLRSSSSKPHIVPLAVVYVSKLEENRNSVRATTVTFKWHKLPRLRFPLQPHYSLPASACWLGRQDAGNEKPLLQLLAQPDET